MTLRVSVAMAGVLALLAACDPGDEAIVPTPDSAADIAAATLAEPGLEVVHAVVSSVDRDVALLEATVIVDLVAEQAYQTGETRLSAEVSVGELPEPVDLGESWHVDDRHLTRDPGSETVRPATGDLSDLVLSDGSGASGRGLEADLVAMLDGWPGDIVDTSEVVGDTSTLHARIVRIDGDVVDVWVDRTGRLVRVDRTTERSIGVVSESRYRYLDAPPPIPPLPPLADR